MLIKINRRKLDQFEVIKISILAQIASDLGLRAVVFRGVMTPELLFGFLIYKRIKMEASPEPIHESISFLASEVRDLV